MSNKTKQEIILDTINSIGTEIDVIHMINENIFDYLDDDWENDGEYEDEFEWYADYGRGEAEGDIHNDILRLIEDALGEPIEDWYFNYKYGDINELIYEVFPSLQT